MARRLGLGAALIAGAVAILLLAAGYRARQDAKDALVREAETLTETLADQTTRFVEAADVMLDRLRQLGEDTNWADPSRSARLSAELRRLRNLMPAVMRLGIWDAEGRRLASTEDNLPSEFSVAGRPYFIFHREGGDGDEPRLAISEPMNSLMDGSTILVLSRRLQRPDGSFAGVATLSFKPSELTRHRPTLFRDGPLSIRWLRDDQKTLETEGEIGDGGGHRTQRKAGPYPLLIETTIADDAEFNRWLLLVMPHLALGLVVLFGFGAGAWILLRWAMAEDVYRSTLATLAMRLRRSNADLEERVEERTKALSEAVAQRDLLMKEVNHRLKNSLQLACGLVQMQARGVSAPDVREQLADTVARLQAIARVHDQLYRTDDVRRVATATYLQLLCADLEQSNLASQRFWRVVVQAEPIDLATDQAVPIGLIVNELVTNALKHGQPVDTDVDAWTVEVGLVRVDNGRVRLTVRDHGTGLPDGVLPRRDGSLGMKLLQGLIKQLDARLTVENASPGARFAVEFLPQTLD